MRFAHVFVAIFLGTALIVAALILHRARPAVETAQPSAQAVLATGKCAECHRHETSAIVHQFEKSKHARVGVTCLDCHRPVQGQKSIEHNGFTLSAQLTSNNCASCHTTEHDQFMRSRHAAPAWAAVRGTQDFTPAQIAQGEMYHPGWVKRAPNELPMMEGPGAIEKGCGTCHSIGKPNSDGSIGSCTNCHSRHNASVATARMPTTCGQCHMGPDHSQLEIYDESKHGVLFAAQHASMNLDAPPKTLTTEDMPIPTCSTCHMSGLEGMGVTHDVTERLSWYLFAQISEPRPMYLQGQNRMKQVCLKCHARSSVDSFYKDAETVVGNTNDKVKEAAAIMKGLRDEGLLTPAPMDEPIENKFFDLWHYFGRTSKHGAFMGGPDFVQWHGNYEIVTHLNELRAMASELREKHRLAAAIASASAMPSAMPSASASASGAHK
jgi:hypothetical protein